MIGEAVLDPRGHLLYCTTLPREGVKAALPNTRKQTNIEREAAKTRKQRNMPHMKGQIKTPEKELNEMEIINLSHADYKTLVIRMFKELSEDLSSIQKIQSEMKDTPIEMKKNLQGNNSRVDEAENQINDLEHKEAKKKQQQQKKNQNNKKKEESKENEKSASSLWTTSRGPTLTS